MQKPTFATLLGLAWPIIISRSTQVVIGLADALMVTHLGEPSLAAVTAGALNSAAAFIFPMGVAFIIASFSSQLMGKGDAVAARRFGWYGMLLALLSQLLMMACLPLLPWALGKLAYAPEVDRLMVAYMTIRLLSTGLVVGMEAFANFYGGLGNTSLPMKASVAAMVMNVPLNWVLINGHCGAPAMGVRGAALANLIATGLAFAGLFAWFLWQGRGLPRPRLRLAEFGRMLRFGLPSGLNWSFEFFAFIAFVNVVVAGLGTASLAAMMAVMQINSVSFMPAFGLASAGAILAGQSIGGGRKDEVPGIVKLTFQAAGTWMGLVSLVYLSFPRLLLAPFVPARTDGTFLTVGVGMLLLSACWQLFDAAGMTLAESLRAAGDTAFPMWVRGSLAWGVLLPGSLISVRVFGGHELAALFWMLAYLGLLSLALFWRFQRGSWRRIQLVEPELVVE